jgi:hypothetical protein
MSDKDKEVEGPHIKFHTSGEVEVIGVSTKKINYLKPDEKGEYIIKYEVLS